MRRVLVGIVAVAIAAALAVVWSPSSPVEDVSVGETVSQDISVTPQIPDFYDIDVANLVPAAPGTMIKSERIKSPNPRKDDGLEAFRFLYHSTTYDGKDIPVSGLYVVPAGDPPKTGWPVVAYAHGTMGAARQCGVSIAPFRPRTPAGAQFDFKVRPLVEQGWAVVATDYQGMGPDVTPMYLLGEAEGRNVLDSVRAVQQWRDDLDRSKTMLWGHSQGGHAVTFASQIQQDYAPDLEIPGVVSIAPAIVPAWPVALKSLIETPGPSGQTYFVVMSTSTWARNYPDLDETDIFTEEGLKSLPAVEQLCADELNEFYQKETMSYYVKTSFPENLLLRLNDNQPGGEPLDRPMLLVQGMADKVVINQATPAYFSLICQNGATAQLALFPDDNHKTVIGNSADQVYAWINDRFDRQDPPSNCPNQERG
jgi:pimeloyl-ACP methyl ester carboxylesterase